jgi:RHS repeat-associated protein
MAKATDNLGASSVTVGTSVVVGSGSTQAYYIHSDQIDTARLITNDARQSVWKSELEPFGANPPDENPQGQGTFVYNNRFPGQYFDRETGLHYNYYRDYDPQTGRYIQSDPIGLEGGINTYGYVEGNPLSFTDPKGLQTTADTWCRQNPIACAELAPTIPTATQAPRAVPISWWRTAINYCFGEDGPSKEECDQAWRDAREYCRNLYVNGYRPNKNGKGEGGMNEAQCVSGKVPEACGGTKVEW